MKCLPDAEDIPCFKTGSSSPGTWLERAGVEIERAGGRLIGQGFGTAHALGRAAYMIVFEVEAQRFQVVWPVLPCKAGNERHAERQAATLLYHDVKARCLTARVLGFRRAFFGYLMLPDGRQAADHADEELTEFLPAFPAPAHLLPAGNNP